MSVRVNLLPEATRARGRASSQRQVFGLAGVLVLLVLAGIWWWADAQVRTTQDRLADAQAVTAGLRTEVTELVAFSELADRRDDARETLTTAMRDEVSLAAVLQDLAAVMPSDTQLETLAVSFTPSPEPTARAIGALNMTGRTLTSHAPGVERVLLQLDKIVTFGELYLNSSTLDEPDARVATFSLDGQIRREARTERYVDGLPEVLR